MKMLMILYTRDIVSIKDLAEELETNPRNIPEFRKELEEAGYLVETISGRYGGYRLKKNEIFPTVRLTDAEKKALVDSFEYMTKQKNFPSMPAYRTAMEKIMAANRYRTTKDSELIAIPRQPFSMSEEELGARYTAISECIEHRMKFQMEYRSNDNVVRKRIVHPYELFMYNNAWFMLSYSENATELRYFKLNRIVSFSVLPQKFTQLYGYREGSGWHEYIDEFRLKKIPDWKGELGGENASMRIKLHLSGKPAMYAHEYLYGLDQVITDIDKDNTIIEFTAEYKYNTVQLVLGFGADCKVLEPGWLKDEVINQIEKTKKLYTTTNNTKGETK
jgi:predicted DNA-binding transcriptional regulator YafY